MVSVCFGSFAFLIRPGQDHDEGASNSVIHSEEPRQLTFSMCKDSETSHGGLSGCSADMESPDLFGPADLGREMAQFPDANFFLRDAALWTGFSFSKGFQYLCSTVFYADGTQREANTWVGQGPA